MSGISKAGFYSLIKELHEKRREEKRSGKRNKTKRFGLLTLLLDSVDRAMEEATIRDLYNIDGCAMGRDWEYERDEKGRLVLCGKLGNPIVKRIGVKPDWKASAWRLGKRNPKQWGDRETIRHEIGEDTGKQIEVNFIKSKNKKKK